MEDHLNSIIIKKIKNEKKLTKKIIIIFIFMFF